MKFSLLWRAKLAPAMREPQEIEQHMARDNAGISPCDSGMPPRLGCLSCASSIVHHNNQQKPPYGLKRETPKDPKPVGEEFGEVCRIGA